MVDWTTLKAEYITTDISYRGLSEKYGVQLKTIGDRASREKWVQLRQQHREAATTKKIAAETKRQVDRYTRMLSLTDKLLDRIEASIELIDGEGVTLDKSGIRALAGAIKDIKEIQGLKSELDTREQKARISKMEREAEREDTQQEIVVRIAGDDGYAE